MTEHAAVRDRLRTLILPLDRLSPGQVAEAIRTAGQLGHAFGEEFRACVLCLIRQGRPIAANPQGYFVYLVEPWAAECGLKEADRQSWDEAFSGGTALRDPRVQAFCAGLAEQAWRIAAEVERERSLLARYLEVRPGQIALYGIGSESRTIFGVRDDRYQVLTAGEAAGKGLTSPHTGGMASAPCPLAGLRASSAGEAPHGAVNRFLDRWILHWRERREQPGSKPLDR